MGFKWSEVSGRGVSRAGIWVRVWIVVAVEQERNLGKVIAFQISMSEEVSEEWVTESARETISDFMAGCLPCGSTKAKWDKKAGKDQQIIRP